MSSDLVLAGKDVEEQDAWCASGHCSWTGEGSGDEDVVQSEGEQVEEEEQVKEDEEGEEETEDDCEGSSEEAWWRTASLNREDVKLKRNAVADAGSWSSFFVVLARRQEDVETRVLSSSFSRWEAIGATTVCATTELLFLMRKPGDLQLGSKIS